MDHHHHLANASYFFSIPNQQLTMTMMLCSSNNNNNKQLNYCILSSHRIEYRCTHTTLHPPLFTGGASLTQVSPLYTKTLVGLLQAYDIRSLRFFCYLAVHRSIDLDRLCLKIIIECYTFNETMVKVCVRVCVSVLPTKLLIHKFMGQCSSNILGHGRSCPTKTKEQAS